MKNCLISLNFNFRPNLKLQKIRKIVFKITLKKGKHVHSRKHRENSFEASKIDFSEGEKKIIYSNEIEAVSKENKLRFFKLFCVNKVRGRNDIQFKHFPLSLVSLCSFFWGCIELTVSFNAFSINMKSKMKIEWKIFKTTFFEFEEKWEKSN